MWLASDAALPASGALAAGVVPVVPVADGAVEPVVPVAPAVPEAAADAALLVAGFVGFMDDDGLAADAGFDGADGFDGDAVLDGMAALEGEVAGDAAFASGDVADPAPPAACSNSFRCALNSTSFARIAGSTCGLPVAASGCPATAGGGFDVPVVPVALAAALPVVPVVPFWDPSSLVRSASTF